MPITDGDGQCRAESSVRSIRPLAASDALREAIGLPLLPGGQQVYRRRMARAREMLDEELLAAAWAEGRAMTMEQAISYAFS